MIKKEGILLELTALILKKNKELAVNQWESTDVIVKLARVVLRTAGFDDA